MEKFNIIDIYLHMVYNFDIGFPLLVLSADVPFTWREFNMTDNEIYFWELVKKLGISSEIIDYLDALYLRDTQDSSAFPLGPSS